VWFARSVHDFATPSAAALAVPSLVGQTENDALAQAASMRLRGVVVARRSSDRFPASIVMGQDPKAGVRVREGRQVSLIVSSGVQIFPMPDLRYLSLRNVELEASRLRLRLDKTKTVANDDVPAGRVVEQDPPPLTSVREGTKVSVSLSKGPPSVLRVPSFVSLDVDEARKLAAEKKVHLGQIVWTPIGMYGPPRGEVVRQSPAANAQIDPFDTVSLQVSAGPREAGYIVRQAHAGVTVPPLERAARVRVEVRDETGTWNAFDSYAEPNQKLDFNVTAVGTAEINVYVNNELQSSETIGVEPKFTPLPRRPPEPAETPQ
jgi:serine/threonine-protein kinase